MKRLVLFLVLGVVAFAPSAFAVPITLSAADVDGFVFNAGGSSGPAPDLVGLTNSPGVYTASWLFPKSGAVSVDYRLSGLSIGMAGDDFFFVLTNIDEHAWSFSTAINGGVASIPILLSPLVGSTLISYLGISGPITQVDIFLQQTIPVGGTDRVAEFEVAAIPEPGTLLLLGSGLTGLGLWRRRRA